jgi:serine/threonine-protein kinase
MYTLDLVENWYYKALDVEESAREEFLRKSLCDDPRLLTSVLILLTQEKADKSALTLMVDRLNAELNAETAPELEKYGNLEEIGRGGMSIVYKADRIDGLMEKQVAIKLMKRGMDSVELLRRFEQERNVLSRLQHPNIGQIYDAGLADDGRPYFVMELVRGKDVLSYASENQLDEKARLHLFVQVCNAVEFAHQNLIIHRDIKPGNILVNNRAEVKLMDFGIARVIRTPSESPEVTIQQRLLTPEYASPEQLEGNPIDIRSDVYQLGLLLQKLVSKDKNHPVSIIAQKASAESKEARYPTVAQLTDDIRRYLEHKPIEAKKPGPIEKARLFVQRNKAAVTSFGLAAVLLVAVSVIYVANLLEAYREAERKEYKASQSLAFLVSLFEQNDPTVNLGEDLNIGIILQQGAEQVAQIEDVETRATIMTTLGKVYTSIGNYPDAEQMLSKAIELLRKEQNRQPLAEALYEKAKLEESKANLLLAIQLLKEAEDRATEAVTQVEIKTKLASLYDLSKPDSASFYKEEVLDLLDTDLLSDKDELLYRFRLSSIGLGKMLKEQSDSVFSYKVSLVEQFERSFSQEKASLANLYFDLSERYRSLNKYDSALFYGRKNLQLLAEIYGPQSIRATPGLYNLSNIHGWSGNYDSAGYYSERSLALKKQIFGDKHVSQIPERDMLASLTINDGDFDLGEEMLRDNYQIAKDAYGDYHKTTGGQLYSLLQHLNRQSKLDESTSLYPLLFKVDSATYGMTSNTASTLFDFAQALWKLDQTDDALEQLDRAIEIYAADLGKEDFLYGMAVFYKGKIYQEIDPETAITQMLQGITVIEADMPENHPRIGNYQQQLAEYLSEKGRDSLSNVYYQSAIDNYLVNYKEDAPHRPAYFQKYYAESLIKQGKEDSARALATNALELIEDTKREQLRSELRELLQQTR